MTVTEMNVFRFASTESVLIRRSNVIRCRHIAN